MSFSNASRTPANQLLSLREHRAQVLVIRLLRNQPGCEYLGNWIKRPDNRNIVPERQRTWLTQRDYSPTLCDRAFHQLERTILAANSERMKPGTSLPGSPKIWTCCA